jgi:hypothetical protein
LTLACGSTTGTVGTPLTMPLVTTGGLGPMTYSITSGTLPPGLTLNPVTGIISGTPTEAGNFTYTAQVVDALGNTAATPSGGCAITIVPPLTLACGSTTGTVGTPLTMPLVTTGGLGPMTYSITTGTLPPGLTLDPATGIISGTPTAAGNFTYTAQVVDALGNTATTPSGGCAITIVPATPCISLTKTANKATIAPYESVTYSYTVCNCGGTTLNNVVVRDDNGTPDETSDDFVVGTIPTIAPNDCATLSASVIPPVTTTGVIFGTNLNAGVVIVVTTLANGDIKVTYWQDFGINDNTYGTGAIGWGTGGHKFGDLTGSDKLEFRLFAKDGSVAMDLYLDCITLGSSVTLANGWDRSGVKAQSFRAIQRRSSPSRPRSRTTSTMR